MVWFVNKLDIGCCKKGTNFGFVKPEDRIFQSVNIMYNIHRPYNARDIQIFQSIGVNIFNVDRTTHSAKFLKNMQQDMKVAENLPEMYPKPYYTPVGLAVTMSVHDIVQVDERVDLIILKDVTMKHEIVQVKTENVKFSSMPIMAWLSTFKEDTVELIKISDGIIVDLTKVNDFKILSAIVTMCKQASRPVFYLISNLIQDYSEPFCNDRKILVTASQLIKNRIDGVFLEDAPDEDSPKQLIVSLVKAIRACEKDNNFEKKYFALTSTIKVPIIPPLATALAASLAAIKIGASAIFVFTASGRSAKLLSNAAPPCRVLAITAKLTTARRMHLYRNIMPLFYDLCRASCWHDEYHNRISFGTSFALKTGLLSPGAKLVVLAPSEDDVGYCDTFQIISVPFKCSE